MDIRTFRAKSIPQTLDLIRRELGPTATVLHTRELNRGLLGRLIFGRQYEVAATAEALDMAPRAEPVASRAMAPAPSNAPRKLPTPAYSEPRTPRPALGAYDAAPDLATHAAELLARGRRPMGPSLPPDVFDLFTDLIQAEVDEQTAREILERLLREAGGELGDAVKKQARLAQLVASELPVCGPIALAGGECRIVALVGPTGVGKTTTIAKLAANFRLRENKRVGLITVDTYRIAAVEQLRTYADIIDLPMEVVGTPRQMREAVGRLRDCDLVLVDTAGRSPRDEVRIRELRTLLAEAEASEVHLVLSAASGARGLTAAAEKFATAGLTAVIVTKLDEATGLGHLLTLARHSRLPFSYLTDGQNVPDDIAAAESRALARAILEPTPALK